ncbi:hypothetical protein C0J50_17183 [Silurus asotus]|uniref:Uncharacterized protein n=1 Tax=Silurus asotus TaxID=30991 RepID=A0AAD5FP00_SILAS|nr:hypothetical protein C0J50_17183 [Silurus asotus]
MFFDFVIGEAIRPIRKRGSARREVVNPMTDDESLS